MRILKLTKETQNNILENLLKRSPNSYGEFESRVNDIIQNVREKRDEAVFEYTLKFDGATIDQDNIRVTEEEIKEAYEEVDDELIKVGCVCAGWKSSLSVLCTDECHSCKSGRGFQYHYDDAMRQRWKGLSIYISSCQRGGSRCDL